MLVKINGKVVFLENTTRRLATPNLKVTNLKSVEKQNLILVCYKSKKIFDYVNNHSYSTFIGDLTGN